MNAGLTRRLKTLLCEGGVNTEVENTIARMRVNTEIENTIVWMRGYLEDRKYYCVNAGLTLRQTVLLCEFFVLIASEFD